MYLIIDIGNTRIKAALFKKGKLVDIIRFKTKDFSATIKKIAKDYNIKHALLSSVGKLTKSHLSLLDKYFHNIILDHKSKVPFINKYATPKTLGVDRIALASAATTYFPKKNVLIIDAGTCVTYDFVTQQSEYLGGAIAPGIYSRYKSLHDYTENLPMLDKKTFVNYIGDTTEASIHSGVVNGISREIDGVITQYLDTYEKLTVVLTGGDAEFLSGLLKSSIFVRPSFLVEGLYTILKLNT